MCTDSTGALRNPTLGTIDLFCCVKKVSPGGNRGVVQRPFPSNDAAVDVNMLLFVVPVNHAAPKHGVKMQVREIDPSLFERALVIVDSHTERASSDAWKALASLASEHGEQLDDVWTPLFERARAYMVVSLRWPASTMIRRGVDGFDIPSAFAVAAATLPLTKHGNFDPRAFARSALLAWPAGGVA